jgi:DNA-binding transcriptional ArsR family regulator
MANQSARLEHLITTQIGECCEGDVEIRLQRLQEYRSDVPASSDSDRSALKTLGDETRYTVVRLLAAADRELCVCEIGPVVDVSDSAISHALSDLQDAGLVKRRKEGTWRYYDATDRAQALLSALDETRSDLE